MNLKLLVFGIALAACRGDEAAGYSPCQDCFQGGTYKCVPDSEQPCVCHVGFMEEPAEDGCRIQEKTCSDDQCGNGKCIFRHGGYMCDCQAGSWGRRCEHTDSEVEELVGIERELALKHCKNTTGVCEPPHLQVYCSSENLDLCDEKGNIRPFKKCPYPWFCFEAYRNGQCDWECERSECLYDGYECATNWCNESCLNENGSCDWECNLKLKIEEHPTIAAGATLIEITLGVSEQFWWDNRKEIIANLSQPLRTPLIYVPEHNGRLEANKNSLEKVLSRGRRSIVGQQKTTLNLELAKTCKHDAACAADGSAAISQLSTAGTAEKHDPSLPDIISMSINSPSTGISKGTLLVCLIVIVLPVVLVGYRVVSAPVWVPPKSEDEAPVIWSTQVTPPNPFNGTPTPLHEEAFHQPRIGLPIQQEYVNRRDEQGRTPLFWLIVSEKSSQLMIEDVNELVRAGANPNLSDDKGNTPLSVAIRALRPSVCDRLAQWGADPAAVTHSGASCLHLAVAQDDVKCVQWLLTFPAVTNNINEVDESDRTPLAMAAQGGMASAQIAEILIGAGADVDHQGSQFAMWRYRGRSALHWATLCNNLDVMKVLLQHRCDLNCVDVEGNTSLHLAAQRCSEAAVRMLLDAHANTEIANGLGLTPLAIAKEKGVETVLDLIAWYTDVRKEGLALKKKGKKRRREEKETREEEESMNKYSAYSTPASHQDDTSVDSGFESCWQGSTGYTDYGSTGGYYAYDHSSYDSLIGDAFDTTMAYGSGVTAPSSALTPPLSVEQHEIIGEDQNTDLLGEFFDAPSSILTPPYSNEHPHFLGEALKTGMMADLDIPCDQPFY